MILSLLVGVQSAQAKYRYFWLSKPVVWKASTQNQYLRLRPLGEVSQAKGEGWGFVRAQRRREPSSNYFMDYLASQRKTFPQVSCLANDCFWPQKDQTVASLV